MHVSKSSAAFYKTRIVGTSSLNAKLVFVICRHTGFQCSTPTRHLGGGGNREEISRRRSGGGEIFMYADATK